MWVTDVLKNLTKIFCTLPVSTCTAGKFFSAINPLKWYLGTRMTYECVNGLVLMYIHPGIAIEVIGGDECVCHKEKSDMIL